MNDTIKKKSITVWLGVNKNGKISIHTEEPIRDEEHGVWKSNSPFLNSVLYANLSQMIERTQMNWESGYEIFQIQI